MTEPAVEPPVETAALPWTCPFCPLLCDSFGVKAEAGRLTLVGSDCPRAIRALSRFDADGPRDDQAAAQIDGKAIDLDSAIAAAARILFASRQPLIAGLGCDVAGARALYRLAADTGAIGDVANGATFMHGLRALQDRGAFTTTLAEVRTRADLIVCVGCSPRARQPEFFGRCGLGDDLVESRHVVFVGAAIDQTMAGFPRTTAEAVPLQGDLFETLSLLSAALNGAPVALAPGLTALLEKLRAARYAVLVWEAAALPAHGALLVEALNRIVGTLNRTTRAAMFPIGGGDGAATANQVFAWLSGLPIRSRAGPAGLEHEPLRFDADSLLADDAVDALLWVSSIAGADPPAGAKLPLIVLGTAPPTGRAPAVFIPVSTPGIGSAGHLFRTDGVVLLPLRAARADGLPAVADVATRLRAAVAALQPKVAA